MNDEVNLTPRERAALARNPGASLVDPSQKGCASTSDEANRSTEDKSGAPLSWSIVVWLVVPAAFIVSTKTAVAALMQVAFWSLLSGAVYHWKRNRRLSMVLLAATILYFPAIVVLIAALG